MNSRTRVRAALAHQPTDRVPRLLYEEAIGYTPPIRRLLEAQCAPRSPREYFDMDLTAVKFNPTSIPRSRFREWLGAAAEHALAAGQVDEWGVWRKAGDFHHFTQIQSPLRGIQDEARLRRYPWPDLDQPYRFEGIRERVAALHAEGLAVVGYAGSVFERAWSFRGFEDLTMDLLEKPIATRPDQVLEIERLAHTTQRRVMVCFVLRFAAFYRKVREIIQSGALGELASIQASEGVMPWHQAHSFVRGHWSVVEHSSPMILSKCCHDTDIVHWLAGRPCRRVASFGSLEYFRPERAPVGVPARCTDRCPVGETCPYNALRYTTDRREPWLGMVYDRARDASVEEITAWLRTSPWGRCVYRCDNDAVDRQVIALEFTGGLTGTFTMTAFEHGRHIEVYGTRGVLKGGETYRKHFGAHLIFFPHEGEPVRYTVQAEDGGYELHGGGDAGLVNALYDEMTKPAGAPLEAGIDSTVHSHLLAFAAEESRLTGRVVELDDFRAAVSSLDLCSP